MESDRLWSQEPRGITHRARLLNKREWGLQPSGEDTSVGKGTASLQEQDQSRRQHSFLVLKDGLRQPLSSLTLGNEANAGCCEEEALHVGGWETAESRMGANSQERRGEHWLTWRFI